MNNVVKKLQPRNWRTQAMHDKYENERTAHATSNTCPMCATPALAEYTHWRIIKNIYPYDAIAVQHDMVVPKRHVDTDRNLNDEERVELFKLKETVLNSAYSFVTEALPKGRSIPGHYHLHLIVPKIID